MKNILDDRLQKGQLINYGHHEVELDRDKLIYAKSNMDKLRQKLKKLITGTDICTEESDSAFDARYRLYMNYSGMAWSEIPVIVRIRFYKKYPSIIFYECLGKTKHVNKQHNSYTYFLDNIDLSARIQLFLIRSSGYKASVIACCQDLFTFSDEIIQEIIDNLIIKDIIE